MLQTLKVLLTVSAVVLTLGLGGFSEMALAQENVCSSPALPTTAKAEAIRDVVYSDVGKGSETALDIFTPDRKGVRPVVIFIHGGGWQIGDKANDVSKSVGFVGSGFVYVTINYRLVPSVMYPDNVQDVANAVAWMYRNIAAYGGDANCLFVMGHSAGAHLAALVSTDEQFLVADDLDLSVIKGTVLLDGGSYDLTEKAQQGNDGADDSVVAAFGDKPDMWKAASPINHIAADKSIPPMLLVYVERREFTHKQAVQMSDLLTKAGVESTVYSAAGKTHMTLNRELGEKGDVPTDVVLTFIRAQIHAIS